MRIKNESMRNRTNSKRRGERGQTIILVAVSLVSLMAMAALAIDVVTFYVARSEAQRAADAAALAGAKGLADSGVTTLQPGDANLGQVKVLATQMANAQIAAILLVNTVAGRPVPLPVPLIDFTTHGNSNPLITVTVQQTGLPTFFARIWGRTATTVQASATAEAYNPSNNSTFTPIAPLSVKPWLMANLDPNAAVAGTPFVDPSNNTEPANIVGSTFNLTSDCNASMLGSCTLIDTPPKIRNPGQVDYLPALVTPDSGKNVCPSCQGASDYERAIECADVATQYTCGTAGASWDNTVNPGAGGASSISSAGAQCLTHAVGTGLSNGQDSLSYPVLYPNGPPVITAGQGGFGGSQVSTSSSIVTIPIIDQNNINGSSVNIVGFLQGFINQVECCTVLPPPPPPTVNAGDINITVLNVAGCSGASNGATPVVGGSGTSPVPVRLITTP
jgi:hypothetical protein